MNLLKTPLITIPLLTLTAVMTLASCNQTNTSTGTVPAKRVGLDGE